MNKLPVVKTSGMARSENTESTKLIDQIIFEIESRLIREEKNKFELEELDG